MNLKPLASNGTFDLMSGPLPPSRPVLNLHLQSSVAVYNAASRAAAAAAAAAACITLTRSYIIPKPFDERLLPEVAGAVVEAAIATGVARLTDIDIVQYKRTLADLALRTSM
jgi:malate dehydrogenase (oxaloacetate-decarboxylating)(NADP+)